MSYIPDEYSQTKYNRKAGKERDHSTKIFLPISSAGFLLLL